MIMNANRKVVVVGMGNLLLKDEGIGIHVAQALLKEPHPSRIQLEVIDGATMPDIPLSFEEIDKLIIVDAVLAGDTPGAVFRFHPEDINLEDKIMTSLHQISLMENLKLMKLFGHRLTDIVIIGVQPKDIDYGTELSAELAERIPDIIEIVMNEVRRNGSEELEKGVLTDDNFRTETTS
jgi:hydrogenase maturation protease